MRLKTIKAILTKKFDDWTNSISDPYVQKIVKENSIITGGCIASLLMQEDYNDVDVYFRSFDAAKVVASYYIKEFKKNPPPKFKDQTTKVDIYLQEDGVRIKVIVKSSGIAGEVETKDYQYFEGTNPEEGQAEEFVEKVSAVKDDMKNAEEDNKGKYRPIFLSTNAITLSHKVQLVFRFYGEPEEIHKNYDFDHCKSYWTSWDKNLVTPQEALLSILSKTLRYSGSLYPICSVIRTRKFIQRGWKISAGQYLKMCFQISQMDLSDPAILEDQLVGVDQAYFKQVLDELKKKGDARVDGMYLMEVIDKLF